MSHCIEPIAIEATRRRLRAREVLPDAKTSEEGAARLKEINRAYFVRRAISQSDWYGMRAAIVDDSGDRAGWWRLHPDIPPTCSGPELERRWDRLTRSAQHALVCAVVAQVVVHPQPAHTRGFRPERLQMQLIDAPTPGHLGRGTSQRG